MSDESRGTHLFCRRPVLSGVIALVSVSLTAIAQGGQAGPVTGVIDAVAFESDQFYVHGWACQEGQPSVTDDASQRRRVRNEVKQSRLLPVTLAYAAPVPAY